MLQLPQGRAKQREILRFTQDDGAKQKHHKGQSARAEIVAYFRTSSHLKMALRTRFMVFFAAFCAFLPPASRISQTCLGCASNSLRRACTGSIHVTRFSDISFLQSTQPIAAVRQSASTFAIVSGSENNLCHANTGQISGRPGSVRRWRCGSVIMLRTFARISSGGSVSQIALP